MPKCLNALIHLSRELKERNDYQLKRLPLDLSMDVTAAMKAKLVRDLSHGDALGGESQVRCHLLHPSVLRASELLRGGVCPIKQ